MGTMRERQESTIGAQRPPASKRLKKSDGSASMRFAPDSYERPKSKKELRTEKKAARKEAAQQQKSSEEPLSVEELKKEKQRLKKEQRKELLKEKLREERRAKKIRQQRILNRELNAPKSSKKQEGSATSTPTEKSKKTKKQKTETTEEQEVAMKVLSEVIRGSKDESGMTTTQLGVQYKDVTVGDGAAVKDKSLVAVQYKLTGGKFGAVIDSSKLFRFRVGKGEVIRGWDIGLVGMRVGGRRKLIVPPKAGYGSKDIGAGPGGILFFDITVKSVRGG